MQDDDCDGSVDEEAVDRILQFIDADNDETDQQTNWLVQIQQALAQ